MLSASQFCRAKRYVADDGRATDDAIMMRKKRLRSALGAATVEGSRSSGSGDGSPGSAAAKGAGGGARARRHCASKGKQQYLEVRYSRFLH